MKCYNHHDKDAFGICRICGKGLCLECMSHDKEYGIYCKNDSLCRKKSELNDKTLAYNEKVIKSGTSVRFFAITAFICMFAVFICIKLQKLFIGWIASG